jgi:hypothetical protein
MWMDSFEKSGKKMRRFEFSCPINTVKVKKVNTAENSKLVKAFRI